MSRKYFDKWGPLDLSSLGETNIAAPTQWYGQNIGNHPLREAALLGTLGAGAGYFGSGTALRVAANALRSKVPASALGMDQAEYDRALEDFLAPGEIDSYRPWGAVLGGAAGLLYPALKSVQLRGAGSPAGSTAAFYAENPEVLDEMQERWRNRKTPYQPKVPYQTSRSQHRMGKQGSDMGMSGFSDPFAHDLIPISYANELVMEDPFLTATDKMMTTGIVSGTEGDSGMTSGRKIMRTALQAGIGFAGAYGAGKVFSKVLALPKPMSEAISRVGGLAGALANTGFLADLRGSND